MYCIFQQYASLISIITKRSLLSSKHVQMHTATVNTECRGLNLSFDILVDILNIIMQFLSLLFIILTHSVFGDTFTDCGNCQ